MSGRSYNIDRDIEFIGLVNTNIDNLATFKVEHVISQFYTFFRWYQWNVLTSLLV